jgi:hypothetical protein
MKRVQQMRVRVMCVYIKPKGVDETRAKVVRYFSFFKEGRKRLLSV